MVFAAQNTETLGGIPQRDYLVHWSFKMQTNLLHGLLVSGVFEMIWNKGLSVNIL